MSLGQRVRELRNKLGLNQDQLGEAVNVDRSFISMIENNQKKPGREVAQALAKALHVSLTYLLEGQEGDAETVQRAALIEAYERAPEEIKGAVLVILGVKKDR